MSAHGSKYGAIPWKWLLIPVLVLSSGQIGSAEPPPNIILILADDLGYGDLGCYGQREIQTPNIDRLAAEGMRFINFHSGSTVCAPSRCVLMTGLHLGHSRIRGNSPVIPLEANDVTVSELLKGGGYSTAIIGKWGLGHEGTTGAPDRKGFDESFGFLDQTLAHNYYPDQLIENGAKVAIEGNADGRRESYAHDLFTAKALEFLDRQTKEKPFFLYLAYTIPHANNEEREKGMQVPSDAPYSEKPWPQAERNFAAMITRMDRDVGRVMERLKRLGIDERTLVFFSSDNGPHREGGHSPAFFKSSGPLRGIKRDLYEGGIRVPLIVRWPGRIKAGSESAYVGDFADFLPTAAEVAKISPPSGIDGISILPELRGEAQPRREYLYWEFHEGRFSQAVRFGRWKGVRVNPGMPLELYDLATDLGETRSCAAEHPEVVDQLEKIMVLARTTSPHWPSGAIGR